MQWLLSILVVLAVVGGLGLYLGLRGGPELRERRELAAFGGEVALELEATADLGGEPDPFALDPGAAAPALRLGLGGGGPAVVVERLPAGEERRLELEGLVVGRNEILIEAAPVARAAALRLRLLVDGHPRASRVLWLEPGGPTVESVQLELQGLAPHGHAHD